MTIQTSPQTNLWLRATRSCIGGVGVLISLCGVMLSVSADAHVRTTVGVHVGGPSIHVGARSHRGADLRPRHSHIGRWSGTRLGIGLYMPLLPIGYGSYWYNNTPYYGYGDNYYVADGRGYRVIEQPGNEAMFFPPGPAPVVAAPPTQNGPTPVYEQQARTGQLYAYPLKGQTDTQATFDRIECETVGSKQTGYHPGQPMEKTDNETTKRDYQKAVVACLEGRGYRVM